MAAFLLVALALVAPVSLGASTSVSALALVVALSMALARRGDLRGLRPVALAVAAFIGVMALAALVSPGMAPKWKTVQNETWLKLLLLAIPVLAVQAGCWRRRALDLFLLSSTLVAIFGIYQHYTGVDPFRGGTTNTYGDAYQVAGFFGHHLTYGGHVMVAWSVAMARLISGSAVRPREWIGIAVALVLLSVALLWSHARSAQIGAAVALVVLALLGTRKMRSIAIATGIGILLVGLAMPGVRERARETLDLSNEETRINLWTSSLHAIQERPLLGYGPGRFQEVMAIHEVEGFYDSRAHSHNDYLMHGVNAGLIGLVTALVLLVTVGVTVRRGHRRNRGDRWILDAGLAALCGIMAAGLFQVYSTDDEVEVSLFLVLGCALGAALDHEGSVAIAEDPQGGAPEA